MFTSIDETLTFLKNLIEITENSKDAMLIDFLNKSKGITYRPYIVAAYFLSMFPPRNGLKSTSGNDGATWVDYKEKIRGFILTQKTLDCGDTAIDKCWRTDFIYLAIFNQAIPTEKPLPQFFVV